MCFFFWNRWQDSFDFSRLQVPVVGTWPHHSISIMVRKSFGELAVWDQIQAGQDNKGRLLGLNGSIRSHSQIPLSDQCCDGTVCVNGRFPLWLICDYWLQLLPLWHVTGHWFGRARGWDEILNQILDDPTNMHFCFAPYQSAAYVPQPFHDWSGGMACQIGIWLSKPYRSLIQGAFAVGWCWAIIYRSQWRLYRFSRLWRFSCLMSEYTPTCELKMIEVLKCRSTTRGRHRTLQQGIWRSCIGWASQCFVWSSVVSGLEIDGPRLWCFLSSA